MKDTNFMLVIPFLKFPLRTKNTPRKYSPISIPSSVKKDTAKWHLNINIPRTGARRFACTFIARTAKLWSSVS